jgi:rubrerythrin
MGLDDCPHCGAELEITWTTANPGALLGDQVAVPRAMRCPNANQDEVERLQAELDQLRRYLEDIDQHADKRKAAILLGAVKEKDAEVERLRDAEEQLHAAQVEIGKLSYALSEHANARLRELLGRLEWVEQGYNCVDFDEICPVCQADKGAPHRDDCWLGKELGS